ncbi:integrase family protein [Paraburkholderia sp. UCT31]|uniref:integrase family protein n=1 Tax=Paraburkholderia sp. UCT31 TaxID=2615209 RepID=UPI00165667E4|nr:integrase family protein [Paraburkholderia sp. UCT31]MBC8739015.1 integrase family protein [Paraburkholderia sp. UCT31]
MARIKLTAARVREFACEPGKAQAFLWDSEVPGLALRATAQGAQSYVFQASLRDGREFRLTIGKPRDWDISQAREEARRLQRLIDAGHDPRVEKAATKQAARETYEAGRAAAQRDGAMVCEAWAAYLEHLRTAISPKTKKPRSARYLADHEALASPGGEPRKRAKKGTKTTAGPLASLMDLRLADLTAARVAAWLEMETAQRPTNAAHAYRLLKAFIRWSAGHDDYTGIVGADAWQSPKVTGLVPQSKAKAGGSLQREQLRAWFKAVRELDNPVASAYLQATLICGARREEMASLKWVDVDFAWNSLHLADKVETQTGRDIPLTPYLASVLAALPRRNEWVFSSPTAEDGKIAEPRFSHNRALVAAGLPHLTIHDLRRSFGTLSEWVECPVGVVAQIQGHKPSALAEKHYRRRPLDLLRVWHTKIEAWTLEQAGIEFDGAAQQTGLRVVQ